jgi:glycosyltransferase involved in cell wall biosynthesis
MPVLNEAGYVESAVRSVLAQEYPGTAELVLALGPSTDGTDDIVAELRRNDPRIRTVQNPRVSIPAGLNRAIQASANPIIVRVDAHTELPDGYTKRAVRTLLDQGAANVGGIMYAVGRPGLQAAIARAYNSKWGLGGGAYHSVDEPPGEAESAYLGVMRADALAEVGYFDESLRRGEDWELNHRLRSAGHRVWLDPALRVNYWPRATWTDLVKQFWATGNWRGELVRRLRQRNSPRFFAPPVLVLATGAAAALTPVAVAGLGGSVVPVMAGLALAGPATYLAVLLAVAAREDGSLADRLRFCAVLATMHYTWGTGFLAGLMRGAGNTVDTSRVATPG